MKLLFILLNFFATENINRIVKINNTLYYELSFDTKFNSLVLNDFNINKHITIPLKTYNANIKEVLCKDTTLFLNNLKNISDIIYIPKKTDIYFKPIRTYSNIIIHKDNNVLTEDYVKKKAIEFHSKYDRIEDVIYAITYYIRSNIQYDINSNTFDDIDNVLKERKGVCMGFTALFTSMMDTIAKIDTNITMIATMSYNMYKGKHICNLIEINGFIYQHDVTNHIILSRKLQPYIRIYNYSILYGKTYTTDHDIKKYLINRFL